VDLKLKGKKAIVTGGTRGIGRAIAEELASEGADVAICARNKQQIDDAVKALGRKGVKAWGNPADVADTKALRAWVGAAAEALGGLDIFIANVSALAVATDEAPTGPAMPSLAWQLSDADVAAVVTYIRNAWGNAAPAVSAGEVANMRQTLHREAQAP